MRDLALLGAFPIVTLVGYQLAVTLLRPPWLGPVSAWLLAVLAWLELLLMGVTAFLSWYFLLVR